MPLRRVLLLSACALALVPATAGAASELTVRGAGFGHGVGMSQYGAYGYALHGVGYAEILAHYYTGTALGTVPQREVRVLLRSGAGRERFASATRFGARRLNAARVYGVRARAGMIELLSPTGRRMARAAPPVRVRGAGAAGVQLLGRAINGRSDGSYRGVLELRPNAIGGVQVVNALGLDAYVQGVVPGEVPASWPAAALQAQAVAARTYAITTSKGGNGFDQYPDTRSQVYRGLGGEQPQTNAAVQATRGQVVTQNGLPVVTYFFSTSGGKTEDVENTPLGDAPLPWLKSVDDPYDDVSPRHRWSTKLTVARAEKKLGSLVKGDFRGIDVLQRGRSPRVVRAEIVGSDGRTPVTGATLRARLGLYDTWAYFTTVSTETDEPPADDQPVEDPTPQAAGDPDTGGASSGGRFLLRHARQARATLTGRLIPARPGQLVVVQHRTAHRGWRTVGSAPLSARGRYALVVYDTGRYRVRLPNGSLGPVVRVR